MKKIEKLMIVFCKRDLPKTSEIPLLFWYLSILKNISVKCESLIIFFIPPYEKINKYWRISQLINIETDKYHNW
jgi:hypothetical protein